MSLTVGAWTRPYQRGMTGTLGLDLASDSDNLGWTLRSWKYELVENGFRGEMVLDTPVLGDAADRQIKAFQTARSLTVDGQIGPRTGQALLRKRIGQAASTYWVALTDIEGIVRHESSFDIGAIGYVDQRDRGPTQNHIYDAGAINLSQAIRPALAIPRLSVFLARLTTAWDADAAVAAWNIGEGGSEWWFDAGKPATGSPSWWRGSEDMSVRAWKYVTAVRGQSG